MSAYLNSAHIINNQRTAARDVKPGPVVAVVGPPESGKTSLVKILANYAIRSGWSPLLVETDVRCNMSSMPGTLAAVQVRPTATAVCVSMVSFESDGPASGTCFTCCTTSDSKDGVVIRHAGPMSAQ
jgi:polynucleotide 5'-kinase involved in rRNA processing